MENALRDRREPHVELVEGVPNSTETARLRGLAAHLEGVREDERQRLARRLHDDVAQSLTGLGLRLGCLSRALPGELTEQSAQLRDLAALVASLISVIGRIVGELRPPVLDDFGLTAAFRWEAHDFRERTGIDCVTHVHDSDARCARGRAVAVFRTLQDALANAATRGACHVRVDLDATGGMINVCVKDDGSSVPVSSLPWNLLCMRERAHQLGGTLEVESPAQGGASIRLRVPACTLSDHSGDCFASEPSE